MSLLGVLQSTGGLARVTDKRHVRRDLADYFSTRSEGVGGRKAVAWRLGDEAVPRVTWEETVAARAAELAAMSPRPRDVAGIELTALDKTRTGDAISYRYVSARLDRGRGEAAITVRGPEQEPPAGVAGLHEQGARFWPLAVPPDLDDPPLPLPPTQLDLAPSCSPPTGYQ